jgi:aminoglycoside phosphotransferase (APT) family kinase protein
VTDAPALTRSDRDPEQLRLRFADWLRDRLGAAADPSLDSLEAPSTNGMSSETLLVDATWTAEGRRERHRLVARLAPPATAVPIFPTYDLAHQHEVIRLVGELSDVPVPRTYWLETDPSPVGAQFFVMERVDGQVPPDVMPYDMEGWLLDATEAQRRTLARSTVEVIAAIHAIDEAPERFGFLAAEPGASPLRAHVEGQRRYYDCVRGDVRFPTIESAFDWLEDHWPAREGPAALSWGDARIGNVIYRDFEPVAVLDWEMAAVAPREVDLGWTIFMHRFFEDICEGFGLPGLPDMLPRADVLEWYEAASGYTPRDIDWYLVYAALRHALVMARVGMRQVHFGEVEPTGDPEDLIMHLPTLRRMVEGSYWDSLAPELR